MDGIHPVRRTLDSLEGMRFLASIAILLYHYIPYVAHWPVIYELRLAVDMFFVVSGIVIAYGYLDTPMGWRGYPDFIRRRLARIYPLHLLTLAFYVVIGILMLHQVANAEKYRFDELPANLLLVHAWRPWGMISFNYVSWSISAEFFVYLIFPVLAWLVHRSWAVGLAIVLALLVAAFRIAHAVEHADLTTLAWNFGVIRAVPGFAFGVWLYAHRERMARLLSPRGWRRLFGAASLVTVALAFRHSPSWALVGGVWIMVASAFQCDWAAMPTWAGRRFLSSRGHLTYSIYMLHTVVATIVIAFVGPAILGGGQVAVGVSVAVAAALTYALARLSYTAFEQPMRIRLNRLRIGPRLPATTKGVGEQEQN